MTKPKPINRETLDKEMLDLIKGISKSQEHYAKLITQHQQLIANLVAQVTRLEQEPHIIEEYDAIANVDGVDDTTKVKLIKQIQGLRNKKIKKNETKQAERKAKD